MHLQGVLLHVAGLWLLSVLDATGKWLVMGGISVLMVAWFRYVVHVALMTVIVVPQRGAAIWRTHSLPWQMVRGTCMIATTVLFFSVLGRLPLAEGTAMNFMAPLFLMAMAPWLLGEPHRLHRWVGVLGGFAGMLIVVRPGTELDPIGIALGLLTALVFAFFQMATRRVGRDDPLTTNFYGGVFGAVVLTLALPWFWSVEGITPLQWVLLASTGVTGFFGHWLQITAYSRTPATLLAPFSYLQILAATTLGWALFGQLPGRTTALGIGLICVSGLGVVLVEVMRAKRTSPALQAADGNKKAN